MTKVLLYSLGWSFLFLIVLMSTVKKEGAISFAVENTWAASHWPDEQPLRYVRLRSSGAPKPGDGGFIVGQRWHSGFPYWSLYVDAGTNRVSGLKVWYAKLDLYKTTANWLVALVIGFSCSLLQFYVRNQKEKGS
jgi:hypothetical protein